MLKIKKMTSSVREIIEASPRVKIFRLATHEPLDFVPGQFVMASVPGFTNEKGIVVARSYSIASSPLLKGAVELCISLVDNGAFSAKMHSLRIGDEVALTGPYGMFVLKKPVAPDTVFIAGGTGIAPLISMLRTLYAEGFSWPLWLFYGVRTPSEILYKEELDAFVNEHGLRLFVCVSKEAVGWQGERGYVTAALRKYLPPLQQERSAHVYLCGPPAMVASTVETLKELGFRSEQIHKEQW